MVTGTGPATGTEQVLQLKGARTLPSALLRLDGAILDAGGRSVPVQPMVDSGASGMGFVDVGFAKKCGVTLQPSQRQIALADGSVVRAAGEVKLDYTLAAKSGPPVKLSSIFVVTPLDPYQMILGIGWLGHHDVKVAFHERSMRLRPNGQGEARAIRAVDRIEDDGSRALTPLRLTAITDRSFQRMSARDDIAQVCAVFVRPTKNGPPEPKKSSAEILASIPGGTNPRVKGILAGFIESVLPEEPPPGIPPKRGVEHAIELKPEARPPVPRPLRHGSSREAEVMREYIDAGLKSGQLQPSTSPYGSMALVVLKKDGTPRVVIDYRAVNEITVKNKYPLPLMDELFDRVVNAKWFTKIDLRSGFHQIAIRPEDREKTAFRTRYGSFEYTVLPMGLCNAPGTFMQLMNETFADMLDKSVLCFLDDILIFSRTEDEHEQHVRAVLRRLRERKLYAKLSKCEFFQKEVEFLGHRIGADGLRVSPDKISAVKDWPVPSSVTEVRSFLGLANFYRRFVNGYSRLALPMSELTKETVTFRWEKEHQSAFDEIKAALCSSPVLVIPDQSKQFVLNCDACKYAIGAVLQQDHGKGLQPVAYFSAKMNDAERNYDVREKEFMAIYRACLHWRPYLHGTIPFRLMSDHKSLVYFMTMPNLSDRLARWVERMQQFDCGIEYIKGEENVVADALSRRGDHEPAAIKALNLISTNRYAPLMAMKENEPEEIRQRNRDAAEVVAPSPDPSLPPPGKDGTIKTPTQRCTADTTAGRQCAQRTAVGNLCWNHLRRDHGLRVKLSGIGGAGRGLFVARPEGFPKGHKLPYTGDMIDLSEETQGGAYVLQLSQQRGVDAARRNAGVARWVNDPRGAQGQDGRPLKANCDWAIYTVPGTSRRIGSVRTLRPVLKGEELLVQYGKDYWRFHAAAIPTKKAARQYKARTRNPQQRGVSIEDLPPGVDRSAQKAWKRKPSAGRSARHARVEVNQITGTKEPLTVAAKKAAIEDEAYMKLLEAPPDGWSAHGGLLLDEQDRLRVPVSANLRTRLLAELHDSTTGAHAGRDRMLAEAQKRFHWEGLSTDVEKYVTTCLPCQRNKPSKQLTPGLMMPLPIPEEPCMHWTTDAVSGLPKTKRGHTAIQVYVDRCTKLKRFAPARTTDGSEELAGTTLRTIIGPHGMPKSMVSDRDPRITARFWQELQRILGSEVKLSTAFHPQSDGQSEREIQTLITALRGYVGEMSNDWDEYLPALELAFNSKVQASTGTSPFYLVYGVEARLPIDCMLDEAKAARTGTTLPAVGGRVERMKKALAAAFDRTELAQARQKRAADQKRRLLELKVGDQVLLSTEGLQMRSGTHKLTARYIGPFPVIGTVNDNAVTLEFPPLLRALHPTVNISRLKLYKDGSNLFPDRPQRHVKAPAVNTDTNGVTSYEVERIVAQRGAANKRQMLVRWVGYAPEHDEWKPRRELLQSAPEAVAEYDAMQQPDAALAAVTVTGTPPASRLVGIEPNPGPCQCHGNRPAAEQVVACNNARCSCRAAGVQCTAACGCGASGAGATTTRCYNCPTTAHWHPAAVRRYRLRRQLSWTPLMSGVGAYPRMAAQNAPRTYTRGISPPAPRLVGIELNPGPASMEEDPSPSPTPEERRQFEMGQIHYELGRARTRLELCMRWLERNPPTPENAAARASAELEIQHIHQSVQELTEEYRRLEEGLN
jgi:hypothetical protein